MVYDHAPNHYSTATDDDSGSPYIRNWTKMVASSTIVPSEPMSQGRLVRMYSFSIEWKIIWYRQYARPEEIQLYQTHPCTVGQVAQQRQHEEEQRQALTRLFAVVLDDLRYPGAVQMLATCASTPRSGKCWTLTQGSTQRSHTPESAPPAPYHPGYPRPS